MAYDNNPNQTMQVLVDAVPVIRPSGTATPEFMIKIDRLLSSTIKGNEDFAELLWHHSVEERMTAGHAAGDLKGTSTIQHSLLTVHVLAEAWMPALRQKMRTGDNIDQIIIVRMSNLGRMNTNEEVYTVTFTDCKLDRIEEYPDRAILSIRVTTREDTAKAIDQDGSLLGNSTSDWDYSSAARMPPKPGGIKR